MIDEQSQRVDTTIRLRPLSHRGWLLLGYEIIVKSSRLVHGIRYGFKIPYKGPSRCVSFNNHRSTINFSAALIVKLNSEFYKGRIAGPFQECPLNNFH